MIKILNHSAVLVGAGSAETSNDVSQIENLRQLYLVKNEEELHRFLRRRVGLSEALIKSYEKIKEYFGEDATISLAVVKDAEYQTDKQLFIFISPNCSFDEAIKTEERFINDWWLDVYERSSGYLNILLEFK